MHIPEVVNRADTRPIGSDNDSITEGLVPPEEAGRHISFNEQKEIIQGSNDFDADEQEEQPEAKDAGQQEEQKQEVLPVPASAAASPVVSAASVQEQIPAIQSQPIT